MKSNKRVESLRNKILHSRPSLDIERARLITQAYRESQGKPMVTVRGWAMFKIFTELPIHIAPGELIVGSPTTRPRAAQIFPEIQAGWIDQELDLINTRDWDPLYLSEEDKKELRKKSCPSGRGKPLAKGCTAIVPRIRPV